MVTFLLTHLVAYFCSVTGTSDKDRTILCMERSSQFLYFVHKKQLCRPWKGIRVYFADRIGSKISGLEIFADPIGKPYKFRS